MVQGGEEFRFAAETSQAIRVDGNSGRKNLERNFAAKFAIARAVNFAHAARSEQRSDFVRANSCTGSEGHVLGEL